MIKSRMIWVGHVARMRRGKACAGFWWGNPGEGDHWRAPGVERILLRWIFRKRYVGGMDWIELVQDRDRWRTLVNEVMKLRVS
jgi:hypothetical protein